jgi:hypothetical protein
MDKDTLRRKTLTLSPTWRYYWVRRDKTADLSVLVQKYNS